MSCYHHFTPEERERILTGRIEKKSIRSIAKELGRSPSSVSRELKRNDRARDKCRYSAIRAQRRYKRERKKCRRSAMLEQANIRDKIELLLQKYWSPEQISNRLALEKSEIQISHSSIYRGISNGLLRKENKQYLRHKSRVHKGSRCGRIPVLHSIHDRPEIVNRREEMGHWESDTVICRLGGACIATHVERTSRYTILLRLSRRGNTEIYMQATAAAFKKLPTPFVQSFTVDHGKEFAGYQNLMKSLNCIVYFADPYSPNQRGTNENTNGLLRQFVPKGTDIAPLTQDNLDQFAFLLNSRPRKCLGWKSPLEVFFASVLHLT